MEECYFYSQNLLKSAGQHFYPSFSIIWAKLSWKTSLFVRSEILGLPVNTLTVDDKYTHHTRENSPQPIQMWLSKKPKPFVIISLHFWNLYKILNILRKKKHVPHGLSIFEITDSSNTPPWMFFTFFNCTNGTKSRNASQITSKVF